MRSLADLSCEELRQAVIDMCDTLGIATSRGDYDLIGAVHKEWNKAVEERKSFERATLDLDKGGVLREHKPRYDDSEE